MRGLKSPYYEQKSRNLRLSIVEQQHTVERPEHRLIFKDDQAMKARKKMKPQCQSGDCNQTAECWVVKDPDGEAKAYHVCSDCRDELTSYHDYKEMVVLE